MMQYSQQPQNILAVIYDGFVAFKRSLCRLWPLLLLLLALHLWLTVWYSYSMADLGGELVGDSGPAPKYRLTDLFDVTMLQVIHSVVLLLSVLAEYLVLGMIWVAIDRVCRFGAVRWQDVTQSLRQRGVALALQGVIMFVIIALGAVMLVVPAVILYVLFYQARFYVFLDGFSPLRSFKESAQLVWGTSLWRTFVVFTLTCACTLGCLYGVVRLADLAPNMSYLVYIGFAVVGVVLEVLFASWQLALFNDLKLRWALPPASESSPNDPPA